ncbi:ArnT family glycosyltransferase [Hufsiella ginkgonis]|uniref:Phospholipid carrier-dependent glycosyltransferase n=1 Tax=Hufsiella ginkgonis TaxID=2695274 RepID=A0A7K1XUI1_9SPHI|nr:hypothetical protein [Hufsiella ginkgonis]MXV14429.1 hypothetical protein [Hufsiella ginkgonis]
MIGKLDEFIERDPGKAFIFLLVLAIPAFFVNLGLLPLFADEPTRANVALEMILSKNYSVPTIGGEYYYNKPPLYNWILAATYLLSGNFSEFATRLPAIVPLFLFTVTIWLAVACFLRDKRIALLSAILFMVNSRMLLYDSMLGHIDIFYSWLTFGSFMLIFHFYRKEQWLQVFLFSYLITAVTFLCKGLPSIVFQGMTLIALLAYTRNLKKLFSWQHILPGLLCVFIIGAYFYNYSRYNPNLGGYFATIWDQSSQRTAVRAGLWKTFGYVLTFPFEHLVHLLPASLLLLFCVKRSSRKEIFGHPFLRFLLITFLANIWIYWLSPETRPRYLLMLYPLLLITFSYGYYTYRDSLPKTNRVFNHILLAIACIITLAVPSTLFAGLQQAVPLLGVKTAAIFVSAAFFTWLIYRLDKAKIVAFAGLLLVARLGFSWFVLPERFQRRDAVYFRHAATEMGTLSRNKPFYFYQYHPEVLTIPFHDRLIFYIERSRMKKVEFTEQDIKPGYYFTFDRDLKNPSALLLKEYRGLKLFEIK